MGEGDSSRIGDFCLATDKQQSLLQMLFIGRRWILPIVYKKGDILLDTWHSFITYSEVELYICIVSDATFGGAIRHTGDNVLLYARRVCKQFNQQL